MEYDRKELELVLGYAEFAEFTAKVLPDGTIDFTRSPLPEGLSEELAGEVEFVAEFYQRSVFQGDLDDENDHTMPDFDDPIDELNFKLKRYQGEFMLELKKSLGIADHRSINPFARAMLQYSAEHAHTKAPKKKS